MKILKSIFLGLALTIAFTAAKADPRPTKAQVVEMFMNAAAHGKTDGIAKVLDNDMEFNTKRGEKTITSNKDQLLAFLNASKNIEQNCKCTSTTLDDNNEQMIVKIEMKYDTYTRTNVVTLTNFGSDTWKITKVNSAVS